jgi:hypothetical protein
LYSRLAYEETLILLQQISNCIKNSYNIEGFPQVSITANSIRTLTISLRDMGNHGNAQKIQKKVIYLQKVLLAKGWSTDTQRYFISRRAL